MEQLTLGPTDMRIPPLCLGGVPWGRWGLAEPDALRMLDLALDRGLCFWDTADVYGGGDSELIIGKAMRGRRSRVVLATKFGMRTGPGPHGAGCSRHVIVRQVEESLRRLQTEYLDLYQAHVFDPATPPEETLRALDDLVRAGKVRHAGCSNYPPAEVAAALQCADGLGLRRPVAVQPEYSLFCPGPEEELLPLCGREGLTVLAYSPLDHGRLSGKYRAGRPVPPDSGAARNRWDWERPDLRAKLQAVERLAAIAGARGCTVAHLSLAYLMAHPGVVPIIGVRSVQQMDDNLAATGVRLAAADLVAVREAARLS